MAARTLSRHCLQHCTTIPTAAPARAFLQIVSCRSLSTTPVLDFLLPSIQPQTSHNALRTTSRLPSRPAASRTFTSTPLRRATTAIYNPRKDDDGNDMNVEITPRAANRLKQIMTKDENPHLALRITVESGGCHGFQYLMSLTSVPSIDPSTSQPLAPDAAAQGVAAEELKLDEDDTVFEGEQGAKVVMDGPSLELLKGSKVDYTMELIGSQFKIVDNPLATSSCGCGTSFDIKA